MASTAKMKQGDASLAGKEKFLVIPIIILILAQMGATGDNGALSLSATALTQELHATTSEIQLANMVYPLVGGAFMIAGGLIADVRISSASSFACASIASAFCCAPRAKWRLRARPT